MAFCYNELGNLSDEKEEREASLEWHMKALAIQERVPLDYYNLAATHNCMGLIYHKMDHFALAAEEYIKALYMLEKVPGERNEFQAGILFNIGRIHAKFGSELVLTEIYYISVLFMIAFNLVVRQWMNLKKHFNIIVEHLR